MLSLESLCIALSSIMYAIFAISFLGVFGTDVKSNVVNNLPIGPAYQAARILYAFLMLFSYPLQLFPTRYSLTKLLKRVITNDASVCKKRIFHIGITIAILLSSWAVAVTDAELGVLIGFVGCTAGPVICYFLPAVFWLKLEEGKPINKGKFAAWLLLGFGIVSTIVSLTALIISLFR